MRAFRDGELQVLVGTTVLEVGVDIPDANIMVVEQAERFGLAQLHQLRGRVGRAGQRSACLLTFGEPLTDEAEARLEASATRDDGFRLAERDLELRGPGHLFGYRQSGASGLQFANLCEGSSLAGARPAIWPIASSGRIRICRPGARAGPRGRRPLGTQRGRSRGRGLSRQAPLPAS